MTSQIAVPAEVPLADVTMEGSDVSVFNQVRLQVGTLSEAARADRTFQEGFL